MSENASNYPIGKPGTPWTASEKQAWLEKQTIQRSYQDEVLSKLDSVSDAFTAHNYGALSYNSSRYPLWAFTTANWQENKPCALVTGGVHGYETSGVQGAVTFLLEHAHAYNEFVNLVIVPCVSPWAYETINRWNVDAVDPNRSFYENSGSEEATQLMGFVKAQGFEFLCHIDLHETTDTDNSEFRPALAARDGIRMDNWEIPDGFYTVANTASPQLDFQEAVITAVEKITHIAPADANGKIIGVSVLTKGVICYDKASLFLCGGFTKAPFATTTEVYPDSESASPEICIAAQVAAIKGALGYLVANNL